MGSEVRGTVRLGRLEHAVAFHLRHAQQASFLAFQKLMGDRALRPGHYAILQLISDNPGLTQGDLCRAVGIDKTTMSGLLKELEEGEVVMRIVDPDDRRSRRLMLRHKGTAMLATYAESALRHDARLDEILGSRKDEFLALLRTVAAGLSDPIPFGAEPTAPSHPSAASEVDDVYGKQRVSRRASGARR